MLLKIATNGSGLGVRAGFSAENSERATMPKFTKNCRTGTFDPPDAKPLCLLHNSKIKKNSDLVVCKDEKNLP
ncbi:hypothetical protein OBK29_15035, partial [Empedobacter falsenii]|uniref:hypothetical protein n=1 Tax=Empedobacter falsenii TaxID=343874 RepID=UPI003A805415